MVRVDKYGFIYRLGAQLLFCMIPMLVYLRACNGVKIISFIFFELLLLFLLFSMGFRSRLIDFFAINIISFIFIKVVLDRDEKSVFYIIFCAICLSPFFLGAIVYLTYIRGDYQSYSLALSQVLHRLFLLNYEVNFERIYQYSYNFGFFYGATFPIDIISAFLSSVESMPQKITRNFNNVNSDIFIMTPTFYGELYVNFGTYLWLFVVPIIVLYRFIIEWTGIAMSRVNNSFIILFSMAINLFYYFPRITATGGVSAAIITKIIPMMVIFLFLGFTIRFLRSKKKGYD